jgi:5'-nucleotidase
MARILVTNDDGVGAPGIAALAGATARAGHDVIVAAPMQEESGMSAALTAVTSDGRIVMEQRPVGDLVGFAVAASPAYIVVLAFLGVFGEPPDLVLSGINRGANAGHAVLHSGTVGAALTAANNGASAMAVSLDVLEPIGEQASSGGAAITVRDDAVLHWSTAASVAVGLLDDLAGAPIGTVLNLNVPDRGIVDGLRQATLAPFGQVQMAVAEVGEGYVRMAVRQSGRRPEPGTDLAVLGEGYAAVTVLSPPAETPGAVVPRQRAHPF